jgi:hypothetical protein
LRDATETRPEADGAHITGLAAYTALNPPQCQAGWAEFRSPVAETLRRLQGHGLASWKTSAASITASGAEIHFREPAISTPDDASWAGIDTGVTTRANFNEVRLKQSPWWSLHLSLSRK